jgi:hypothetical protein
MSTGFYISIWPEADAEGNPFKVYSLLLRLIPQSLVAPSTFRRLTVYRKQRPIEYGANRKDPFRVLDRQLEGETAEEIINAVSELDPNEICIRTTCAYDRWQWNNELGDCESTFGWLDVVYAGPKFERGFPSQTWGPFNLHFDRVAPFTNREVEFGRFSINPELLNKFAKLRANNGLIDNIWKSVAIEIDPQHLILVTEGEPINPLNFHGVYHSTVSGYAFDIYKIFQLHEKGGGYFHEAVITNSDRPYKLFGDDGSHRYGSLRNMNTAKDIAKKLNSYIRVIGIPGLNHILLHEDEMLFGFKSCSDVEVEAFNRGISLQHVNLFSGYLECPYLRLIELAIRESSG